MNTIWRLYKCCKGKNAICALAFFLLYLFVPVIYASEPVIAQYVRINLPGDGRILSLAEVQIYSGKKLISVIGKAKQATTFRNATAEKAIDGKTSGDYFEGSVTHTEAGSFVWWELDLGSDQEITKIVIYNRTDCCAERINPARILLRNSEHKTVWQHNIKSTQKRYEFAVTLTTTSLSPIGRNLLRNATFQQSTNPPLPDYWDLNHTAAVTFKDLYSHYGIDASATGPLAGVRVLKIVNSEANFPYVIVSPTKTEAELPGGDYTYSVYVRADRDTDIGVSKAEAGQEVTKKISTEWRRYSFTFKTREGASSLQPHMYFWKKGTYFVAAPQLEEGAIATPFDAWYGSDIPQQSPIKALVKNVTSADLQTESTVKGEKPTRSLTSMLEYDYYTTQDTARLRLSSAYMTNVHADVACVDTKVTENTFFRKSVQVPSQRSIYVTVPIKNLLPGTYRCSISPLERGIDTSVSTVEIKKLKSSPVEIRFNVAKRFFTINNVPFHIIGIAVRAGAVPPDWYFSDLKDRGINTIFYNRTPDGNGQYDIRNFKSVVTAAAKYDLKVIVGLSMDGAQPANWRQRLSAFLALIDQLKEYPQIIGWFSVDEPSANTWQDSDLMEIYSAIKRVDPYRLVFVNWSAGALPKQVGQQPRGTLSSTDVFATDYYPFTGPTGSLNGFTETTMNVALTARMYNKPFFSWLQLFGGGLASREPTGAELNYMAFTNFIYGGMIGYWDTKSNSAATWERFKTINLQGNELAQKLFLSEDAFQLLQPVLSEEFLYTVWKKGTQLYLIVLNRDSVPRKFLYKASSLMQSAQKVSVRSLFEGRSIKLTNGYINEWLAPYDSKVYEIVPQ